jgi:hypothetical protein
LPRAALALGKAFAESPINGSRQRRLWRSDFCRGRFAESCARQSLCRGSERLCREPGPSAKPPAPVVSSVSTKKVQSSCAS